MYEWMWRFSGLSINGQVAVVVAGIVVIGVVLCTLPFLYQLTISACQRLWRLSEKVFNLCLELIAVPVYFIGGMIRSLVYTRSRQSPEDSVVREPQTTETLYKVMLRQDRNR